MEDFKSESEYVSPIEALFDEENEENIILFDAENNECEFEQIALIPYGDRAYAILKPVGMEGIGEDEAFVFEITEDDGDYAIDLVEDDNIADAVFEEYYKLLDEETE